MRILSGFLRRGVPYPHQLAAVIDNPLRRLWLTPERHADRLALRPDQRILEIGPGSGFYSREVARRLTAGELILLDLSPQMLDKARRELERRGADNVRYVPADATDVPYADELDTAYMVTVLGELPDPDACLRSLHRALRPGGHLHVTEQWPDPDYESVDRVVALAERNGFCFERRRGPFWSYTASFRRE